MNLPDGWEVRESTEYPGRVFYYNQETCECTWVRPIPYSGYSNPWPPLVCISEIFVRITPADPAKPTRLSPRDRASRLITEIYVQITEGGHKIEWVAERHPEAEVTHAVWVRRGAKPPQIESAAWRLTIGHMSEPIETADGFCIILRCG